MKSGLALLRVIVIAIANSGKDIRNTLTKDEFTLYAIIKAKIIIKGALIAILKLIMVTCPIVLQSFVSLVISDDTVNLSKFAKEKP